MLRVPCVLAQMDDDHAGLRAALHEAKEAGDISLQEYLAELVSVTKFPGNFQEICERSHGNGFRKSAITRAET